MCETDRQSKQQSASGRGDIAIPWRLPEMLQRCDRGRRDAPRNIVGGVGLIPGRDVLLPVVGSRVIRLRAARRQAVGGRAAGIVAMAVSEAGKSLQSQKGHCCGG